MYVCDGYGNARVHKFDADGPVAIFLGRAGGRAGPVPCAARHRRRSAGNRLRGRSREQPACNSFRPRGKFLAQWTDVARPCQVFIDASGDVFVAELGYRAGMWPGTIAPSDDATGGRLSIFDTAGRTEGSLGRRQNPCAAGDFFAPHDICVDSRGDIYVGRSHLVGRRPPRAWCRPIVTRCKSLLATDDDPRGENQAMKAWRFYGFGDLRLDDVPEPDCPPGACRWSSRCASSRASPRHNSHSAFPRWPTSASSGGWKPMRRSNFSGTSSAPEIIETGDGVDPLSAGRSGRRAGQATMRRLPALPLRTQPSMPQGTGDRLRPAGLLFAKLAILPEIALVKVDDRISDSEAACLQSLSDSVAAVETGANCKSATRS